MEGFVRELDFSWSLLDSGLTEHFKNHQKKTHSSLFYTPSEQDIHEAFEILKNHIEQSYSELKGKKYQWMLTNIGVFLRVIE